MCKQDLFTDISELCSLFVCRNQLQKQALLVVEENEVLLKKLDIQEEKLSQLHEKQYYECEYY